jgi:hypothetical protein
MDDEKIIVLACGRYFGSFALLVATDQRLLLIDKRLLFMTVEDTRYDMISEIDYNSQVYSATVTVFTMNKTHKFTSIKYKRQLRELTNYVQRRVMEIRQMTNQAPDLIQNTSNYMPMPAKPSTPTMPMQQSASSSNNYYKAEPVTEHRHVRNHFGHVAHLVGTAATKAAHNPIHVTYRAHSYSPYTQGSLITRQQITAASSTYY